MTTVNLEITVRLALNATSIDDLELFRSNLNESLESTGFGVCGDRTLTSTGFFEFPCELTHLHEGLNLLNQYLAEMKPTPHVHITLYGDDKSPIRIFPSNDLAEYLSEARRN
jgi:hypothetical protein